MLKYLLVASTFILFYSFDAQSQHHSSTVQQYDVKSLTLNNGLVQSSVRDMLQDQNGLIWLGTEAGVQVFDGLHLKRLNQFVQSEIGAIIPSMWINQLFESETGLIFIATRDHGLFVYDPKTRNLQQFGANGYELNFANNAGFYQVCQDSENKLWATSDYGLLQLEPTEGNWQVIINNPERDKFRDILCLNDSVILQKNSELVKWFKVSGQSQTLKIQKLNDTLDRFTIKSLSPQFNLVGKHDGLYRLSNDFNRLIKIWPNPASPLTESSVIESPDAYQVNDILYHSEQAVWLGTRYHGLLLIDLANGEALQQLQNLPDNPYSISGNNVTRILQDHSQLIWASIHGVGVDRVSMNQSAMKTYYTRAISEYVSNDINALSEGPDGSIWLAASGKDIRQISTDTNSNKSYTEVVKQIYQQHFPNEMPYIWDIEVDNLNRLWLSTNKGILHINSNTLDSNIYPIKEANTDGPRVAGLDIFEDKSGRIYISDQGAILRYDPLNNRFKRLAITERPSKDLNERFRQIVQHPNGSIYALGKYNIYRLNDNDTLGAFLADGQLTEAFSSQYSAMTISQNGHFFTAARGALLEIKVTDIASGTPSITVHSDPQLPDSYFYAVELDNNNNPWLSTNNGIVKFDRKSQSFKQFGLSDGVLVREFNDRASLRRQNGHLVFAGIDGWTSVSPQNVVLTNSTPKLTLSSFQIGDNPAQSFLNEDTIYISHTDHWIHFAFSALDYQSPKENRYSYFLKGFDPGWRSYGNKSTIDFTGLPPGRYELQARAATKRGDWHPEPLKIQIFVEPPFYLSNSAYSVYSALFIGLLWVFRRYRRKLSDERKHYIELIETSQQRMKLALWGSGDSIWDWCLEDDKVFRTSLHFLGYKDENIGTTISSYKKLIHPDDLHIFEHEVGEVLVGHTAEYSAQYRLKDKNDSWHWVADQGKVIETTASKRPLRLSGTIRDISVIKRHEQELQELNEELEKKVQEQQQECESQSEQLTDTLGTLKNTQDQLVESEKKASLGNLVAGISHEISTPIGVALTASSHNTLAIEHLQNLFLERKLTVKEMEKGLRQLKSSNERIESSINRTAQLIHTFKQVAVDHDQHEWRIIELPFYLIEIVPTFNAQVGGACNFKLEVVDGPFFDAESSPGDLYQIISQLVHNSVNHGFKGKDSGKITIETELKGDQWQLKYSDDGNGIEEEVRKQIFDPFFSTRRDDGFAGLGMHLVSNIVNHSLGGTIECRSDVGKGARFVITLPLRRPNSPSLDMLQDFMI